MADEQAIKLAIEARNRAAEVIAQAIRDQQKFREELRQLSTQAANTSEGNRKLGETYLKLKEAQQTQREAVRGLIGDKERLIQAQQALIQSMREGLGEVAGQAGAFGRLAAQLGTTGLAIGAVAGALTAFVGAALTASKAIGDFQEKQDIAADTLSVSQREIGALSLAATNVGRSFETIQPQIFRFTTVLANAREGSKDARQAFERLGLDPDTFRNTTDALVQVGGALENVSDGFKRNLALRDLFGRGGGQILAVLRQDLHALAEEAERTGNVLSESQQKAAREADAAWDQLGNAMSGLVRKIQAELAPLGTAIALELNAIVRSLLGITDASNRTSTQKAYDEMVKLHTEARRGSEDLKKEAEAQERLNRARAAGLAPVGATPVPQGVEPPSREGSLPPRPDVALGITRQQAVQREEREGDSGAVGLRVGDQVLRKAREVNAENEKLTEEQAKQLEQTREKIALLERQQELSRGLAEPIVSATQAAQTLSALRSQVQSREELQTVEAAIHRQRQEFLRELREGGLQLQQDLTGVTNLIAAKFLEELQAIADAAARGPNLRSEVKPSPFRPGVRTEADPVGSGGVGTFTATTTRGRRTLTQEEQERQQATLRQIAGLNQSAAALISFTRALRSGTADTIKALGQLVAGLLGAAGTFTGNPILSGIGGAIGTVFSLFQEGGRLMQSGGRLLAPAVAAVGIAAAPMQLGGILQAQSGLVLSGAKGLDTELAQLGRGEMVVSHAETENIQRILGLLERRSAAPPAAVQPITFLENSINVTVNGAGHSVQDMRRLVNEGLVTEIGRAIRLQTFG